MSRQAVHDLVKRGILTKDKDGLIDVEMAKIALSNRVRPSSKTSAALHQAAPQAISTGDGTEITSYHIAKTLNEASNAQMARIKLGKMKDEYIEKSNVNSKAFQIARALRDGLTNCGRRIAADVAGLTTAEDCEAVIDREHRALLENMMHSLTSMLGASKPPDPA